MKPSAILLLRLSLPVSFLTLPAAAQKGAPVSDSPEITLHTSYAKGWEEILQQLHCRYELAFRPEALDGNRHKLRMELAAAGKNQHKGVRLRSRAAYVPVAFRQRD